MGKIPEILFNDPIPDPRSASRVFLITYDVSTSVIKESKDAIADARKALLQYIKDTFVLDLKNPENGNAIRLSESAYAVHSDYSAHRLYDEVKALIPTSLRKHVRLTVVALNFPFRSNRHSKWLGDRFIGG